MTKVCSECLQWWHQTTEIKKHSIIALFFVVLGVFIFGLLANQRVGALDKVVKTYPDLKTFPLIFSAAVMGVLFLGLGITYHKRDKVESKISEPDSTKEPQQNHDLPGEQRVMQEVLDEKPVEQAKALQNHDLPAVEKTAEPRVMQEVIDETPVQQGKEPQGEFLVRCYNKKWCLEKYVTNSEANKQWYNRWKEENEQWYNRWVAENRAK